MAWLDTYKVPTAAVARAVGVSHVAVGLWASGRCLPGLVNAYKLERVTQGGVPVSSWLGTDVAREEWRDSPLGDLRDYAIARADAVANATKRQDANIEQDRVVPGAGSRGGNNKGAL